MKYLLGDSHLGRLTGLDLPGLGQDWVSYAQDGQQSGQLLAALLDLPEMSRDDIAFVSLGTHDAAPWKRVPIQVFESHLDQIFRGLFPAHLVFLVPPGVDESRLSGANERTNVGMARWSNAAAKMAEEHDLVILDLPAAIAPLGREAFAEDGVHLSPAGTRVLVGLLRATAERFDPAHQPVA